MNNIFDQLLCSLLWLSNYLIRGCNILHDFYFDPLKIEKLLCIFCITPIQKTELKLCNLIPTALNLCQNYVVDNSNNRCL